MIVRNEGPKYRHELKYLVTTAQLAMLKNRIDHLICLDQHAGPRGMYNIRSLYFDDIQNRCYYENENGTSPREKFRIRIYNHSPDRITLECKRKDHGKTLKTACPLTLEQTRILMTGQPLRDIASQPPLLRRLTMEMMTCFLRPVVLVEYDRVPYTCKNGNVRITFDTNISSSRQVGGFLDPDVTRRPIMPVGQQLLEVKFDEYLPDYIYRNLQLNSLQQTAYSKYYLCRKYTL